MGAQFYCQSERRRQLVREHPSLNGIDYLEVLDLDVPDPSRRQRTLMVYFLKPGHLDSLTKENVRIEGGKRIQDVAVTNVRVGTGNESNVLAVEVDKPGDFSTYALRLVETARSARPPKGFDPILSEIAFSFKVESLGEFDCKPVGVSPLERLTEPPIDYLAKDYASFRRQMVDRLAIIMPDWKERNPADLGIALVEVLAYAADHLSYYQDAVATEAYLGTARRRVSVRRHARTLDYPMHEGCNARTWVTIQVGCEADGTALLGPSEERSGTPLLTKVKAPRGGLHRDDFISALSENPQVFETMYDLILHAAHNEMHFYTWGDEECWLLEGSTQATLKNVGGTLQNLARGDVLIFEEVRGPDTGGREDADPAHRHAVRLTHVDFTEDPLLPEDTEGTQSMRVVNIQWAGEDALPFPLYLSEVELSPDEPSGDGSKQPASVARGNVVLVDHGRTIPDEELQPAVVPEGKPYRPRLQRRGITHSVRYHHEQALYRPVTAAMIQDPRAALPAVKLHENGEVWSARGALLSSDRFAAEFVVEMENDGYASLRFGDNILGRSPDVGSRLKATYRIGNGRGGNVGAEAIAHVITEIEGITGVRNPMPARGGTEPESIEQVKLYAPQAFHTQKRAVTESDYAAVAQSHPEVQKAVATLRWTGSWHTMFIAVDRRAGRPVDAAFEEELRAFLEPFRMTGHDLEIEVPRFVPLEIALTVSLKPDYLRSTVKAALLETFSTADLPDGRRGYFHPDNFTFGQPVYLSEVVATAMQVTGVEWVNVVRFRRWGQPSRGELEEGRISLERLEIARLDNDPNAPENGKIEFEMRGGL